jgi:flagellar motor switch/type III secretory pathway protein FliN
MQAQLETVAEPASVPNPAVPHPRMSAVPIVVQAVLGSQKIAVREIAAWRPGSIIQTDRPAGGPIAIHANSTLIALGDVSLQDRHLRVQITEVRLDD